MAKLTSTVPGAIPGFRFHLHAQGFSIGQASKIEGLSLSSEAITYRGGAEPDTPRKQKGLVQYEDIVISRIYTDNFDAWAWLGLMFEPTIGSFGLSSPLYKTQLTITLYDHDGSERVQFFVKNAWVRSYKINNLDANQSDYAFEEITIAHEGFSKVGIDI